MNTPPKVTLRLVDLVGGPYCVDTVDGQHVYKKLHDHLKEGSAVTLSLADVERTTTAFLNAAVGQLYNEFSSAEIRRGIRFVEIEPLAAEQLTKVIERAKSFFKDPERHSRAMERILNDDDA